MVGATKYVCIVACVVGVGHGQLKFPGASTADADSGPSSSRGTTKAAAVPSQPQDSPQGHPGQTRLFGLDGLLGAVFGDECDQCSVRDQVMANRCCQQGRRHCCQFLQPVVGFVRPPVGPGFHGQVGIPSGFQPGSGSFQPGPPGFIPGGTNSGLISGTGLSGGQKPGLCPDGTTGGQTGFNRFVGAQCVQQCRADVQCSGIQKCCSIGCSTACQAPRGAGVQGFQGNGFQTSGGFIPGGGGGFPVGGGGFQGNTGGFSTGGGGFPVGGGFVQPSNKPGFCPRKINPITDPLGAVGSLLGLRSGISANNPTADETRQEEKQNSRTRRDAFRDEEEEMKNERRGSTRFPKKQNRLVRSTHADLEQQREKRQSGNAPNTRFFGPFCSNRCFNDFDCPGNLKCCIGQLDDCMQCVNPQFF